MRYDSESYRMISAPRKALATVSLLPATLSVMLVRLYQRTISPDHGWLRHLYPYGYCRHEPTCSQYAISTLRTRRYPIAIALIAKRIAFCNPLTKPSDEKIKAVIAKTLF